MSEYLDDGTLVRALTLADVEPGDVVALDVSGEWELYSVAWFEWYRKKSTKLARRVTAFVRPFDRERWMRRQERLDSIVPLDAGYPVLDLVERLADFIRPAPGSLHATLWGDVGLGPSGEVDPLRR